MVLGWRLALFYIYETMCFVPLSSWIASSFKEMPAYGGWRDDLVIKSTHCTCPSPCFGSQHKYGSSQPFAPFTGNSAPSSGLRVCLNMVHMNWYKQTHALCVWARMCMYVRVRVLNMVYLAACLIPAHGSDPTVGADLWRREDLCCLGF